MKGNRVAADSFFTVADEKFGSAAWSSIAQTISVDNLVTFEINFDTTIFFYNTPFSCTINFDIDVYNNPSDTSDFTTIPGISLIVRYDTVTGKPYKGIAMYKFKGYHKFKVRINSISSAELGTIPAIFRLKGQVIVDRKYNFVDYSTDIIRYSKVNTNQLNLEWTPSNYPGAEMFDLEYTHIDFSSEIGSIIKEADQDNGLYIIDTNLLATWFNNNSTRITTASSSYLLNIPYDSGFILFRLRGVQIHHPDQLRWEGNWKYLAKHKSPDSTCGDICPTGVLFFAGHEQLLNWQYSVVFAEEGKRKEVISYFDGSLRNRQSVTLNNTDNKNIVQETIYDALGRPAASILPAPTKDSTIHYFRGFNKNENGDPYSFSDLLYSNCTTVANSLSDSSGTGRYYSSSNQFLNDFYYTKYIPDASGYPFAVTEYMADNTGRIKAQGGVGRIFQLDSTHATRYYYGKPTQVELDRLFGLEAGNASHYLKNMVMDANGQLSVSYLDASGKTIATALAGEKPAAMHAISSNGEEVSVQVSNELIKAGDFTRDGGNYSLSATSTFLAPVTGNYVFNYRVDPLVYKKLYGPDKDTSICSNCYYDLEITIKDDCDNVVTSKRDTIAADFAFDTSCANTPDTLQGVLNAEVTKIGEYYITYTLTVSQDALAFYDSTHLVKNSDIKKLNYFLLEELKKTDFTGCYNDCETCFDKLGTREEFIENFREMYVADSAAFASEDSTWVSSLYDSLYVNCQSIQSGCGLNVCDEKLALLKMDVTPGGQYALYDSSYSLLEIPVNRLDTAWRNKIEYFTDEFGQRDSIMLIGVNGEDSLLIDVKDLTNEQFVQYWKDSWADSLVRFHPEYCYYLWCLANDSSFAFDRDIENWEDADTAMAKGWFDPADYKALLDEDPFFKPGANGASLKNKMKKDLQYFSRSRIRLGAADKNILQFIDVVLYCSKEQNDAWSTCNPDSACRSRNREWFLYKQFYLNLKQKYYEEARRTSDDPVFENCTNCYVGSDLLVESGIKCDPPPVSDFTLTNCGINEEVMCFRFNYIGSKVLQNRVYIKYTKSSGFLQCYDSLDNPIDCPPSYGFIAIDPGETSVQKWYGIIGPGEPGSIVDVVCDTATWRPFSDSTCNYNCPGGEYDPYDRDSISFYVEYGNPNEPPEPPGGYDNCQFYNVFDLKTGSNTSCKFFNVWVCVKDSTYNGSYSADTSFASSCPSDTNYVHYKNKQRRYPEYVNIDDLLTQILSTNPQQGSDENEELMAEQFAGNCEAQANYWIRVLKRCGMDASDSTALRAAFIEICTKGASMNSPYGTSSIPLSISATYHSFEEAIEAILGPGSINDSCTAELLSMPYPYDRQPVLTERVIMETDYGICHKLGLYRQQYTNSGYSGSLHQWLTNNYSDSYTLDSLELDDMLNACLNCNGILKNNIVLPLLFDPQSRPCIGCDSMLVAYEAFTDKFPAVDSTDDDYEILFANFFNHRFGFSLTYQQYKDFLDSCSADSLYTIQLCNAPVTEDIAGDDNACVKDLFATALTNAVYTYIAYIDSVRRDFREAWLTKCMNVEPRLKMDADLYEYHYTLYYYDQSGNLVKTVPPEGVRFLSDPAIDQLQLVRDGANPYCSNNNSMVFTDGAIISGGGIGVPALSVGADLFTIETWINLSTYANQGIVSNNEWVVDSLPFDRGYSLEIIDNKLDFLLSESLSAKVQAQSPVISGFIPLNTWVHLVVQRTSIGTVKMFINGNEIPVTYSVNNPGSGNVNSTSFSTFYIGASDRSNTLSKLSSGKMRHVRIYKRAISATEARQNYMNYCGNPASNEALTFWEPFTEGEWISNELLYERINGAFSARLDDVEFETSGNNELVPGHKLVTTYQYNSLNQVLQQYSPDGDTSVFFYDRLGRLTASQNMRQLYQDSYDAAAGRFSYTRYDSLGRIVQVGEKSGDIEDIRNIDMLDTALVNNWLNSGTDKQVTKTIYDDPVNLSLQSISTSRKRVVASIYLDNADDEEGDSSLYVYDILGNVKTLINHTKAFADFDDINHQRKRRMDYEYDLVSGKVNMVSYEAGKGDQFFYKYQYDADNRVIRSYSSRDKLVWREDASYNYYLHGPLARTELGQYKVQGVDYAYTLQGWLKGINSDSLSHVFDMAHDGMADSIFSRVSRDVYAFKLGYFDNEYTPIDVTNGTAFTKKTYSSPGSFANTGNQLYNGNISYTTLGLSKINGGATTGYSYGYDQLNRLVEMRMHGTNAGSGWSNSNIITGYAESIAYDANGNILKYLRRGPNASGIPLDMDSLEYKYNRDENDDLVNNRLNHVRDTVGSGNYAVDIDDQSSNNYTYDRIGNLISDVAEGIDTIHWTVYGKIKKIVKANGTVITYSYDPGGNRTSKTVTREDTTIITFYVRDAQGNVMAVYKQKDDDPLKWSEQHLYGSSRLGMFQWDTIVPAAPPIVNVDDPDPIYDSLMLGSRTYELSNHLGNVLSTISDKKIGHDNSGVVDYYIAEVLSQNDYYPFGMMQPGRKYEASGTYRYGFNGKEMDNEVSGQGNQYDYGFRIYDPRLGKFLSVDPIANSYPWWTPYQFAGNTPIQAIDLDGEEPKGYCWSNPYVASHPGTGVKPIPSQFDKEALLIRIDGGEKRLMNVYAIQDIDKKTYLIYETATGAKKEQWYIEYDKNGYIGNVNSFAWSTPPNPANFLTAVIVGSLVAVPGIVVYGKAALIYLAEELVEEIIGFPIFPDPGDIPQETVKRKLREEALEKAGEKLAPDLDWDAVVPKKGKYAGEKRTDHIRRHNVDDKGKDLHGIFNGDGVDITNKAWDEAQRLGLKPDETGKLVVPYKNAGKSGGKNGTGETLNNVTIFVVPNTNQIITAFPSQ